MTVKSNFTTLSNIPKYILYQEEGIKDDVPIRINERLNVLAALLTLKNGSIGEVLKSGFSERDFMKWARAMTTFMALSASMAPTVG